MSWFPVWTGKPGGDIMRSACAIVWDLDGTLYRGTEALRAYAQALASRLEGTQAVTFAAYSEAVITRPQTVAPYRDLWNALTRAAHECGLSYAEANTVFVEIRRQIIRGTLAVQVPKGVVERITDLDREGLSMAVVTNSDGRSGRALLRSLGLGALVHRMQANAMKPAGFAPAVRRLFPGLLSGAILSVGDNYQNDVAPALDAGMAAVHVHTPGALTGPVTLRVSRLEEALPWIEQWVRSGEVDEAAVGFGPPVS